MNISPNSIRRLHSELESKAGGTDEYSTSLVRALNEGGLVWESDSQTDSADAALAGLEAELLAWFQENGC